MAKYLERNTTSGQVTEITGLVTSAGGADAGKIAQLDGAGRFDTSLMPVGLGADTFTSTASGALSAGDLVYITGTGLIARASGAAAGNAAHGFVLAASATSAAATMYFEGRNTAVTALTPGTRYYLADATAGALTATPVSGAGKLHQFVGRAVTATSLDFEADDAILLA